MKKQPVGKATDDGRGKLKTGNRDVTSPSRTEQVASYVGCPTEGAPECIFKPEEEAVPKPMGDMCLIWAKEP